MDDKQALQELVVSDCHNAHIYYKDYGWPIEEMGANCQVCDKKCHPIANPEVGIAGELQLLIGYKLDEVADQINALIDAYTEQRQKLHCAENHPKCSP